MKQASRPRKNMLNITLSSLLNRTHCPQKRRIKQRQSIRSEIVEVVSCGEEGQPPRRSGVVIFHGSALFIGEDRHLLGLVRQCGYDGRAESGTPPVDRSRS